MKRAEWVTVSLFAFGWGVGLGDVLGNPLAELPTLKEGRAQRSSSSDPNWRNGNGDARPILPGGELLLADLTGPGQINHIWFTISAPEKGYSRLLVLRMYWDEEEEPSVECPVGDFFGVGHGLDVPFSSLPVAVTSEGRARNCYWPMPFRKSARITVSNEGSQLVGAFFWYVDWMELPRLSKKTAYFHAQYRQEFPAVMGQNYLLADIEGRGHYVGTVLSVRQHTASWWGEGDDFFFVDGEEEPSLRGTGSEDYFCDAWGFRKMERPYYGATVMEGFEPFDRTTVYRWHIPDPVPFQKSLRVEIEHKGVHLNEGGSMRTGFEERADDFSSVAFWYQVEPHKAFPSMPKGHDRLYYDYSKLIEGEDLMEKGEATEGIFDRQEIATCSGGGHCFWRPLEEGQTLTMPLEVQEKGRHLVLALLVHSWDYGIYQFELDGTPVGKPLDLFSDNVVVEEHRVTVADLNPGEHTLTLRNHGKNHDSGGYFCGLDGLLLNRLEE